MENTYYCSRIKSQVVADKIEDLAGRIFVHCKFYQFYRTAETTSQCVLNMLNHKRCLVKLTVQREAKKKLVKSKDRFAVYKIVH